MKWFLIKYYIVNIFYDFNDNLTKLIYYYSYSEEYGKRSFFVMSKKIETVYPVQSAFSSEEDTEAYLMENQVKNLQ